MENLEQVAAFLDSLLDRWAAGDHTLDAAVMADAACALIAVRAHIRNEADAE